MRNVIQYAIVKIEKFLEFHSLN